MPRAIFWNHRYTKFRGHPSWDQPMCWLAAALVRNGWEIAVGPGLNVGFAAPVEADISTGDLIIYTHTTAGHVSGFEGPQWFLKSTGPGHFHTTIDELGYGPYSSIAYEKPPFENVSMIDVKRFFEERVTSWINDRTSKWGEDVLTEAEVDEEDGYVLVLAQTLRDETVDGMWFGNYCSALYGVVNTLAQLEDRPIVVKLHPWTDGVSEWDSVGNPLPPTNDNVSSKLSAQLKKISPKVHVYTGMSSVHDFIAKSRCVVLCNSTSGLEAMLHNKPIISWGYPEYHWVTYDLRHLCDLRRALRIEDWFDLGLSQRFIYWFSELFCVSDYQSTQRRVSELLPCLPSRQEAFSEKSYRDP